MQQAVMRGTRRFKNAMGRLLSARKNYANELGAVRGSSDYTAAMMVSTDARAAAAEWTLPYPREAYEGLGIDDVD